MKSVRIVVLAVATLAAACSTQEQTPKSDTLTQRQKDSAIGQSGLPGASGITKAMGVADTLNKQTRALDSLNR